jgi:hypothetical protein
MKKSKKSQTVWYAKDKQLGMTKEEIEKALAEFGPFDIPLVTRNLIGGIKSITRRYTNWH